ALSFLASGFSSDLRATVIFTAVSLYLYLSMFLIAAFVARRPIAHTQLVLSAWSFAALVAASAGLIGYFSLLPGAYELFTKFGRAAGTFKDPNVFGPFLVVPALYALNRVFESPLRHALVPLVMTGVLSLAVLLSFSRGAWVNLALAVLIFGYLSFVLAPTVRQRLRILGLFLAGLITVSFMLAVAVQVPKIASLLGERATLTQSYDVGPHGRFGGQSKAIDLILDHPFGIGALEFGTVYHNEGVHNVYLNMVLNAGWLGGGLFIIMTALTIILGLRHLLKASATRPMFVVLFSAFVAHVIEGFIVDTDHWRHYYVIMGMMWGLMAVEWHRLPVDARPAAHGRSY
ncbi:MAG: O-antigen ligase family protein, partial [Pseudomonadota bacterium]